MSVSRDDLHRPIDLPDEDDATHIMGIVKKLVLRRDDDTVLTVREQQRVEAGERQIDDGDYVTIKDYRRKRGL